MMLPDQFGAQQQVLGTDAIEIAHQRESAGCTDSGSAGEAFGFESSPVRGTGFPEVGSAGRV